MEAPMPMLDAAATEESPPDTTTAATSTESYKVGVEDKTCFKCGKVMQSRGALRLHLDRVYPCDMMKEERPRMAAPGDGATTTCNKCGKTFKTRNGLRLHVLKLTCDAPEVQAEMIRQHKEFKCEKCQKILASAQSLRNHRSRVFPCDDTRSNRRGNKTCPKCHVTFSSGQGLRYHLNRVTPCNPNRSFTLEKQEKQDCQGDKTCPKCHVTFSSRQSLRLHVTRVIPCDAIKPSNSTSGDEKQRDHPVIEVGEETISAASEVGKEYSCPKCQKKFGSERGVRIHIGRMIACIQKVPVKEEEREKMSSVVQYDDERTQNMPIHMKILDTCSDDAHTTNTGRNKPSTTDLVSLTKNISADSGESDVFLTVPTSESSEAAHNELLGWEQRNHNEIEECAVISQSQTRKRIVDTVSNSRTGREGLVEKKRQRSCDEIDGILESAPLGTNAIKTQQTCDSARQNHCSTPEMPNHVNGSDPRVNISSPTPRSAKLRGNDENFCTIIDPEKFSFDVQTATTIAEDLAKKLLMEKYNNLNNQIITNELALEDSKSYLTRISEHDELSKLELQDQINDLHTYINAAKGKRDNAIAELIAHRWRAKGTEFRLLLEDMVVTSKPDTESIFHNECANIAIELAEKEKLLSGFHLPSKLVDVNPSNNREDTSRYDIELAAKNLLDHERDAIFMRLLRASRRIYLLTKDILLL